MNKKKEKSKTKTTSPPKQTIRKTLSSIWSVILLCCFWVDFDGNALQRTAPPWAFAALLATFTQAATQTTGTNTP